MLRNYKIASYSPGETLFRWKDNVLAVELLNKNEEKEKFKMRMDSLYETKTTDLFKQYLELKRTANFTRH